MEKVEDAEAITIDDKTLENIDEEDLQECLDDGISVFVKTNSEESVENYFDYSEKNLSDNDLLLGYYI